MEHLEDLNLSGNNIQKNDPLVDEVSISDTSTLLTVTAKPSIAHTTATTTSSTSRLVRSSSRAGESSKALLEDNNHVQARKLNRQSSLMKSKYGHMSLDQALAVACPSLQSLDGMSLAEKRAKEAKSGDDGGFHTWLVPIPVMYNHLNTTLCI